MWVGTDDSEVVVALAMADSDSEVSEVVESVRSFGCEVLLCRKRLSNYRDCVD